MSTYIFIELNEQIQGFLKQKLLLLNHFKQLEKDDPNFGVEPLICGTNSFSLSEVEMAINYMEDPNYLIKINPNNLIKFLKCMEFLGQFGTYSTIIYSLFFLYEIFILFFWETGESINIENFTNFIKNNKKKITLYNMEQWINNKEKGANFDTLRLFNQCYNVANQ